MTTKQGEVVKKMSKFKMKWLSSTTLSAVIIGLSVVGGVSLSHAQSADRLQQGFIKGPGNQISLTPKHALEISEDETEIFSNLIGIVIVNDPQSIIEAGTSAAGVELRGDVVPHAVGSAAHKYIGEPVSLASLDRLTRDMVLAFREAGLPVVNVVIPPQDVSNKVVQVIAIVGRLGDLTVEGNATDPSYYADGFGLAPGDVIDEDTVISHLRWKSRRVNRRVDAIYSPGAEFSATDIALDVKETKPWSIFIGADSTGPGTSGEYRFFPGFVLSDLWGKDHEFSYQFTTSEGGYDELAAHVLQYTLPVAVRTDLQLTAAFSQSYVKNAVVGASSGKSKQFGATFISQLDRKNGFNWDTRLGFAYKDSNNAFEFGGVATPGADTEVGQFFALLNGDRRNSKSATSLFAGVWHSPGDLFDNNTDAAFNVSRQGSTAKYTFFRAGLDHSVFLDNDWVFNAEIEGQYTGDRLIGSELIYLGGMNTIRGFQENVIRGDNGILARLELQGPSVSISQEDGVSDSLRLFGFFDIGSVSVNGTATPNEGSTSISGTGVGLTYANSKGLYAELAYGWKVHDSDLITNDNHDGQFHFRVIARH